MSKPPIQHQYIFQNILPLKKMQNDDITDQVQQITARMGHLSVGVDEPIIRKQGLLKAIQMRWQKKSQTLFQFKQLYADRLRQLKKSFKNPSNKTIQDLSSQQNVCQLIGLFKRIQAKRIRAFQPQFKQRYLNHKPVYSDKDMYELQDQTGKVKLQIKNSTKINNQSRFKPIQTPYGVVIKCKGQYSARINRFIVTNVQIPTPAIQNRLSIAKGQKFMVVMNQPTLLQLIQMRIYLKNKDDRISLNICQLIIIGCINPIDLNQIRQFDSIIAELGKYLDVFIIPSSGEHKHYIYPLSPINKNLLQKSLIDENVANCSNPQSLQSKVQNVQINTLISCGQNLLNLKANCDVQDQLQLMKMIIQYRHLCPSSVFSLPIQSYNYDPLVLNETPHLLIHGKCQMYNTELYERTNKDSHNIRTRLVGMSKGDIVQFTYLNYESLRQYEAIQKKYIRIYQSE